MKASRILFLCSAVALPHLAMADQTSPQALGTVHAILDYCTQVDPHDAASFQGQWKNLSGGVKLASLEGNSDYKQAYDLISGELGKISKESGAGTCAAGASGKGLRREDSHHEKQRPGKHS